MNIEPCCGGGSAADEVCATTAGRQPATVDTLLGMLPRGGRLRDDLLNHLAQCCGVDVDVAAALLAEAEAAARVHVDQHGLVAPAAAD